MLNGPLLALTGRLCIHSSLWNELVTGLTYFFIGVALLAGTIVAGAGLYLEKRAIRDLQFAPPALVKSLVGSLAVEIAFFTGAILLAVFGVISNEGGARIRHAGLLVALMAGVCYLELGSPIGALVQGSPFRKIQKPADGGFGVVRYWLIRSARHGYRMGVFFASLLPVIAGLRLEAAGIYPWLGSVLGFFWIATVVWVLRGKALFPAHQPLLAFTAAAISLYSAVQVNDVFLQAFSLLLLTVSGFAAALNVPALLPLISWASGAYFLAVLTLLNSSRRAGLLLLVLTAVGAALAHLSRRRNKKEANTAAAREPRISDRRQRRPRVVVSD